MIDRGVTDTDPIRYGIIGSGMMGVEHIRNINALPGGEVVAVSDPDEGSRSVAAKECDADAEVYADHRDLLESGVCDAVVVASPNHTHVDVLGDVLSADVHALVEKPLCTTVEDCERVIEQAAGSDRVLQMGLEYRYMPPVARLVDEVKAGTLGRVRMVAIREHRFPFLVKVNNWNRFTANTGGTLVEKCCHFFDLMNLVLDERPARVQASGAQDVNHLDEVYDGRTADMMDNAYVIVEYPSGARACLDLCMFAEATYNQEEVCVVGEAGKAEAFLPEGILRLGRRGEHWVGRVDTEVVDTSHVKFEGLHHGSSYLEHVDFLDSIRNGTEPPVTLDDGLWSVAVGVAAHRSIDEQRPVLLSEILSDATMNQGVMS
ncbi:MAG: Gfo/Idh/MocA family oxidoreductase [Actinomycetota bacterium]